MSVGIAEMRALAERAVACKGWRWLSGMRVRDCEAWSTVTDEAGDGEPALCVEVDPYDDPRMAAVVDGRDLPDLTDPATLGCLLALVREAWGDDEAYTRTQPRGGATVWTTYIKTEGAQVTRGPTMDADGSMLYGPTEAHALVAALEAAP